MDEAVIRAMQRWPNVPAVYGWLTLDRRGQWLIKTLDGRFERVTNPAMIEFFGRNYSADDQGRWYVQNGPQRVFVNLEYTPWIYVLNGAVSGLHTHTDKAAREPRRLFLDDYDHLLLETELGIGVITDRDLPAFIERIAPPSDSNIEATLLAVADGQETSVQLLGQTLPLSPIESAEVPTRFRFVPRPAPPAGQPDCS